MEQVLLTNLGLTEEIIEAGTCREINFGRRRTTAQGTNPWINEWKNTRYQDVDSIQLTQLSVRHFLKFHKCSGYTEVLSDCKLFTTGLVTSYTLRPCGAEVGGKDSAVFIYSSCLQYSYICLPINSLHTTKLSTFQKNMINLFVLRGSCLMTPFLLTEILWTSNVTSGL